MYIKKQIYLGDSGYAQQQWLFTPVRNATTPQEERYNAHQKARHPIERCIGVLKSRFRCVCKQRVLMYSPAKAGKIIIACAVLHNIMIQEQYPLPALSVDEEDEFGALADDNDDNEPHASENANQHRIMRALFHINTAFNY